ncbi:MAG: carbohydrate kinase family protein [Candidatus Jordarchaeum sp.]|uniref:carbohydrate kinase family protein n=1 Tax=Candidatus Jordarchaeum sp. TaxID=2823881 RepID=UPI004049ED83
MTPKVIAIGEILIDFVASEPVSYIDTPSFLKCFGGAPMNTIVGVSRLGVSSGVITAVGDDPFGRFLTVELRKNRVDVSHVTIKKGKRTTITFVANDPETGERSFLFYRKPWSGDTADSLLEIKDIDQNYVAGASILHISGFALSQNPCRNAIFRAMDYAGKAGVRISFDPTLRLDMWDSLKVLRKTYEKALKSSDIATFSREEAEYIFRTNNPEEAAHKALRYGIKIVGIKLGNKGSIIMNDGGEKIESPAFKVKPIDTTGAGDGWNAGLLVGLVKKWDLEKCITVANAIGALVVTKRGAITALPDKKELLKFLKEKTKKDIKI